MPKWIDRVAALMLAGLTAATPLQASDYIVDPMRPDTLRVTVNVVQPRYRVNAIIFSDDRRIAIVNGQRVAVGDVIQQATVIAINKAEVIVEIQGEQQSLRMNSGAGQ